METTYSAYHNPCKVCGKNEGIRIITIEDEKGVKAIDLCVDHMSIFQAMLRSVTQGSGGHKCWFCQGDMVWQGDFDFEDYGLEGDGLVANLYCPDCEATAQYQVPM